MNTLLLYFILTLLLLYILNSFLSKEFFQNESNIKKYKFNFYLGRTKSDNRDKIKKIYDTTYKETESDGPVYFELIDLTKKDDKYMQDNLINPNIDYEIRLYNDITKKCDYKLYLGKIDDLESFINKLKIEIIDKIEAEEDSKISGL